MNIPSVKLEVTMREAQLLAKGAAKLVADVPKLDDEDQEDMLHFIRAFAPEELTECAGCSKCGRTNEPARCNGSGWIRP